MKSKRKAQTSEVCKTSEVYAPNANGFKETEVGYIPSGGVLPNLATWPPFQRVQIRSMRNKWASCSSNGILTLNADLLHLPLDLVDYVLCHDLLHLKIPDHGKGFHAAMGCYLPDWREREMRWVR